MQRNEMEQVYLALAGDIQFNPRNQRELRTLTDELFNDALKIIMHRFLILQLMAQGNMPGIKDITARAGRSTGKWAVYCEYFRILGGMYPSELFACQLIDRMEISDMAIEKILALTAGNEFPENILYSHEKLTGLYYHIKKGTLATTNRQRKKEGVYYTPSYIIELILDNTLEDLITILKKQINRAGAGELTVIFDNIRQIRTLDPSCGSGVFLAAAALRLLDLYRQYNKRARTLSGVPLFNEAAIELAQHNIAGVDIDRRAVEFTRFNLTTLLARGNIETAVELYRILGETIITGDFLKLAPGGKTRYDFIVGNPPYVANRGITAATKQYLKANYQTLTGQYDLIVPFVEGSLGLLKTKGKLGFILPNKFLAADFGYGLRKYILDNHYLAKIIDVSLIKVFGDASVYPVITVLQKQKDQNKITMATAPVDWQYGTKVPSLAIPDDFYRQGNYLISTGLNKQNLPVIQKLLNNKQFIPAAAICCGIAKTGFAGKIVTRRGNRREEYKRILQVNNIKPYFIDNNICYIRQAVVSEKQWHSFDGPKLIIPGMAKKLTAAIDSKGSALGRVYYIKEGSVDRDIYFLLGLMNSAVARYFYHITFWPVHLSGGYLRVNSTYLAGIPLPDRDNDKETRVALLAQEAENLAARGTSHQTVLSDIDLLIGEMYGLKDKETIYIIKQMEGYDGKAERKTPVK